MAALDVLDISNSFTVGSAITIIVGLYICCGLYTCYYNVYLHPLRHIPGSKLAVMGPYLEFYHDVIRNGQYFWEIEKMHKRYGPIVRVNPREVHIKDPSYYHTIYASGSRKTNKDPAAVGALDVPSSTVATMDHDQHRARRGYLNAYFSKRSLISLEPTIHERIDKMLSKIDKHMKDGDILTLDGIFSALTADIIYSRFFGRHLDYLSSSDYHFIVRDGFLGSLKVYHLARFMPIVVACLKYLPVEILRLIILALADLNKLRDEIHANGVVEHTSSQTSDSKTSALVGALVDHRIPSHERSVTRLLDEATVFLFAGTESTARTLAVTFFHLLSNPDCLQKLRSELNTLSAMKDYRYSLSTLEILPYLSGVVYEGLRLSFGPIARSARLPMNTDLQYHNYTLPSGTPISQSTYFVHTDKVNFPEPEKFKPERWIKAAEEGVPLKKFLTSFSQGSRKCIGIDMAFTELYLTISRVACSFDFELYGTTTSDLDLTHVRVFAFPKAIPGKREGLGEVRVKILKKNNFNTKVSNKAGSA